MEDNSVEESKANLFVVYNSGRRRQLFPVIDEKESDDLGNVSPLSSGSVEILDASDDEDGGSCIRFGMSRFSDYEVIEDIYRSNSGNFEIIFEGECHKDGLLNESEVSTKNLDDSITSNETPSRYIFNIDLKTPEDAASTSTAVPKLFRKSPFGDNLNTEATQHPVENIVTVSSLPKQEHSSKVRTVLFQQNSVTTNPHQSKSPSISAARKKLPRLFLCSRRNKSTRSFGEINAGVRHKIKKRKPKKIVVCNIMDGCTGPLMEYLNDLKNLVNHTKQIQTVVGPADASGATVLSESNKIVVKQVPNDNNLASHTRKRKGSPTPDVHKKFFKHRRTVNDNMKVNFEEGKVIITQNDELKDTNELQTDDLDIFENDDLISQKEIDNIIYNLNFDDDMNEELQPYSALPKREQSINLNNLPNTADKENIPENADSVLLSPTTQMCNMTSGLVLNSPTKAVCNLNNILNKENMTSFNMDKEKLFPIFYGAITNSTKPLKPNKTQTAKKLKPLPNDQMLLDLGQKKFGATQCTECKFVYHMGDVNDELLHENYHSAASVLRFGGWKEEHVIGQLENARIIRVLPHDPKSWLKKVKDLLDVVNRDLGYYDMDGTVLDNTQVYLYISNKTIVGCLVAEPKSLGHLMISEDTGIDLCSETAYPIKCGVSRIWVNQAHRKQGIGRALLNCLRANFLFGGVLNENDIAFSSPTVAGKAFATKYFNTPNFLVYFS